MEYAEHSLRTVGQITRAVRSGSMSRRTLATLNKRRREMGLSEIAVPDTLAEAKARAADAAAEMVAALKGRRR